MIRAHESHSASGSAGSNPGPRDAAIIPVADDDDLINGLAASNAARPSNKIRQDRVSAAGQLQWIVGFDANSSTIRSIYAPALRCFGPKYASKRFMSVHAIRPTSGPALLRSHALESLSDLRLGDFYDCDRARPRGIALDKYVPRASDNRCVFKDLTIDLSDANCNIVFLGRSDTPARITSIAKLHAPPAAHVALFVATDGAQTVVIPCSAILSSCYFPNKSYLKRRFGGGCGGHLDDDHVVFNGYSYCVPDRFTKWFPMKALRNHERAAREIDQLLPRASAYGQLYGAYPFIVRPPASGCTRISGPAYTRIEQDGTTTLLFTNAVFGPRKFDDVRSYETEARVRFSPIRSGDRFRLAAFGFWPTYFSDGDVEAITQWRKVFPERDGSRPYEPMTNPVFPPLDESSERIVR